ncbi:EamA family transporter [Pectobacteriaceae bacterium CE90]|nr:EamA family transporter [Pectobacteriaceae bacterium CE90]
MTHLQRARPLAYQCISIIASAVSAVLAKVALQQISTSAFLLIFAIISALISFPYITFKSFYRFLTSWYGILAIATNLVAMFMFYQGLKGLDPGSHAFLSRTQIAFGFLLSHWIFNEKFNPTRTGIAIVCIFSSLISTWPAPNTLWPWDAVLITSLSAFLFALNFAILKLVSISVRPATIIFCYNIVLIPFLAMQVKINLLDSLIAIPFSFIFTFTSAVFASLSLFFYIKSVCHLSFFESNTLRAINPYIVALIALPFFPMPLTAINVIGALTMTGALLVLTLTNKAPSNSSSA